MGFLMVRSIVRPEKAQDVMDALLEAGFPAVTKVDVAGRGQQRGLRVGEITYDELPKELLLTVVKESDVDLVIRTIMDSARSQPTGLYGDGKVFVSPVDKVYTISSGFVEE
jgi:nitrogen regulatory protein PII 1